MPCKWAHQNCKFESVKCDICFTDSFYYTPRQVKQYKGLSRRQQKQDNRTGSAFEYANHKNNQAVLQSDAVSSMTLNSGATPIQKGDEQISGIIEIMEELKTQMPDRAKGIKSFAVKRSWLDKLHTEALKENKEFWYLKFAFSEDEALHNAGNIFVVTEQDIIMSMVKTMVEDRKKANLADNKIEVADKMRLYVEAENVKLRAQIELLKARLKQLEREAKR